MGSFGISEGNITQLGEKKEEKTYHSVVVVA